MFARRLLVALAFTSVLAPAALAQDHGTSAPEALLNKMTGHWVMTGTIGRKLTTHDVDVGSNRTAWASLLPSRACPSIHPLHPDPHSPRTARSVRAETPSPHDAPTGCLARRITVVRVQRCHAPGKNQCTYPHRLQITQVQVGDAHSRLKNVATPA
jgi:hypothetical protein